MTPSSIDVIFLIISMAFVLSLELEMGSISVGCCAILMAWVSVIGVGEMVVMAVTC